MNAMKHTMLLLMLAVASWATAQESPVMPVLLTQQLYSAPESIQVSHRHDVTVVFDTVNCVYVRTTGRVDELESLRFPEGKLRMSGSQLIVDSLFPYRSGIEVHTAAPEVKVEARHLSRVTVRSHDGQTAQLKGFEATAYSQSLIFVDVAVKCEEYVSLTAKGEGSIVYYDNASAPKSKVSFDDKGIVILRNADGSSDTYREELFSHLPFGFMDLFSKYGRNHREIPLFLTYSFGLTGASQHPFGGMMGWMGDYSMSVGFHFNYSFHYAFCLSNHWSLGVGFGTATNRFRANNCLLGITPNATDSEPAHLGPVAEPAALGGGQRTWNSKFSTTTVYIPLRIEWRQRDDWRGLRIGAELQPGVSIGAIIYNNGIYSDGSRSDLIADKSLAKYCRILHCGIRFDIAWNHFGLFLQGSLLPFFRSKGENAFDRDFYPMSVGFSFTL